MSTLAERIRTARVAAGKKQWEVAQHLGIDRVNVTQWESGQTKPEASRFPELAEFLGVSLDWLMRNAGKGPPPEMQRPALRKSTAELVGAKDLPVYASAMGGDGHLIVTIDAIEYVKRPFMLEGVPRGYGILVVGDSMSPKYRAGDIVLVHPHLTPRPECEVVLYDAPPTGTAEAIVKTLFRVSEGKWHLRQYNPPLDFTVSKVDWPVCHRIVGSYDHR